jgi:hypothetical protein
MDINCRPTQLGAADNKIIGATMDESLKKQLLLSIIDKILFGLIILIISVVFNYYVEKKIQETARLNQILQSVSRVNSDLVVEQRKGLTKWMGIYFMEVDRHAPTGQILREEEVEKLNEITENIEISINQIDALSTDFLNNERVRAFLDTLLDCNIYLRTEKKLTKHKILAKLDEVKKAYTELLEEIREISIKLARIDYDRAKPDVVDHHR